MRLKLFVVLYHVEQDVGDIGHDGTVCADPPTIVGEDVDSAAVDTEANNGFRL